jgi:hypothetical protein
VRCQYVYRAALVVGCGPKIKAPPPIPLPNVVLSVRPAGMLVKVLSLSTAAVVHVRQMVPALPARPWPPRGIRSLHLENLFYPVKIRYSLAEQIDGVYLTTLLVFQTIASNVCLIVKRELERMRKEAVEACSWGGGD